MFRVTKYVVPPARARMLRRMEKLQFQTQEAASFALTPYWQARNVAPNIRSTIVSGEGRPISSDQTILDSHDRVLPRAAIAGTPQTATATAYDIFGNVVTGYDGTVNFTTSDTQAVISPNSVMASTGVASALTSLRTAGPQTVTATDSVNLAITGTEDVTISAAKVASIKVVVSPLPQTAYVWKDPVGCSVGAFVLDAYGNHVNSSDSLQFTSTDPLAHIPITSAPGVFPVGFTGFTTQGQQTVTATDPSSLIPPQTNH